MFLMNSNRFLMMFDEFPMVLMIFDEISHRFLMIFDALPIGV